MVGENTYCKAKNSIKVQCVLCSTYHYTPENQGKNVYNNFLVEYNYKVSAAFRSYSFQKL